LIMVGDTGFEPVTLAL